MNEDILQKYKQYVYGRHGKHNTRHTYIEHIRVMLQHIQKPYDKINQDDIDKYVQYCFENRKTNGNAIRFWSIRKFITWTKRTDLAVPTLSPVDAGKLALPEPEAEKILNTIENLSPLHRLIFYLEYDTIRRPDEIRKLKLNDRYKDILAYDGKTGRKNAFMTKRLIKAWDDYIQHQRPIPRDENEAQYLLISNSGKYKGLHYKNHTNIDRVIKEICMYSKVEIPQGQTPSNYLIKRTSITLQLKYCNDPKIIQTQAGHTKLQTTMKYNRINEEHIRIYLNSFEDKRPLFKEKNTPDEDKSFLFFTDRLLDNKDKRLSGEKEPEDEEDVGSFTFTHFSFDINHCPQNEDGIKIFHAPLQSFLSSFWLDIPSSTSPDIISFSYWKEQQSVENQSAHQVVVPFSFSQIHHGGEQVKFFFALAPDTVSCSCSSSSPYIYQSDTQLSAQPFFPYVLDSPSIFNTRSEDSLVHNLWMECWLPGRDLFVSFASPGSIDVWQPTFSNPLNIIKLGLFNYKIPCDENSSHVTNRANVCLRHIFLDKV